MERVISRRALRKYFSWKYTSVAIGLLFCGWIAAMQFHRFFLAFLALITCILIAAASWITSKTVRKSRPTKKQLRSSQSKRFRIEYRAKQLSIPVAAVLIGLFLGNLTYSEEQIYELAQYNGILVPANDPPSAQCPGQQGFKFFLGGLIVTGRQKLGIIYDRKNKRELLGAERNADGTLAVNAHIFAEDGRTIIAEIDRNHFEINRNKILDSLSPPRPDRSTIIIKDEFGNRLVIRFLNKDSVSFSGKLYYKAGHYVLANSDGIYTMPEGKGFGTFCVDVVRSPNLFSVE